MNRPKGLEKTTVLSWSTPFNRCAGILLLALPLFLASPVVSVALSQPRSAEDKPPSLAQVTPQLVVQLSHTGHLTAMDLSGNGHYLLTASWDQTVRLWDATNATEIRFLVGHRGVVSSVALSRDGRLALTGGEDGTARLWNSGNGAEQLRLNGHSAAVTTVAFSDDASLLATGSEDQTVRLWRSTNGRLLREIKDFSGPVSDVVFSPDGKHILVASHLFAELYVVKSGKLIRRFEGHTGGVAAVAFSPDERLVLTGSGDDTVRLWDAKTGREIRRLAGHTDDVTTVSFTADGRQALTAGEDHTARLWNVATGEELRRFADHSFSVVAAALSPDGKRLYTASENIVHAWEMATGDSILRFQGNSALASAVTFSPDGRTIVVGSWDDTAHLWDAVSGIQYQRLMGHTDDVRAVAFSPDGDYLLTGSRDGSARLWDAAGGREIHRFIGHGSGVRPVAFSGDGRMILTGSDDKTVRIWAANSPFQQLQLLGPHPAPVVSAVFSPDGQTVLTASANLLILWDVRTGAELGRFKGHADDVQSVAFSADGRLALSTGWDKTIRLWELESGHETLVLRGHEDQIYKAVFAPDGATVLSGGLDNTARLWDVATAREIRRFTGHTDRVVDVAFAPNGRFALTAGEDRTVRLWDIESAHELCRLIGFQDGSWAVVDEEGRYDAANGGDVAGLHWVVDLETIALEQLKDRYYEPGLLAKKLGFSRYPIRDVRAFTAPRLFPGIHIEAPAPDRPELKINLRNRGGGIGRVVVYINGKEMVSDARGPGIRTDVDELTLKLPVKDHPYLIPGTENVIEVRAFNDAGDLESRGVRQVFRPPATAPLEPPVLWAFVCGISDYEGDSLDLRFADKDARDFANALTIGATRLFGAGRVRVSLLTSTRAEDAESPTKATFEKTMEGLQAAKPWDIVVVYLAGHGIALGDDYYYLTRSARTSDLADSALRQQYAVSGVELATWLKASPALKQVMILDTCAAGQAALKLTEQRDISSGQIRAIERLKDRTGFHVLMGSAADAVSYETSRFEQGLLTYALLQGMKGAALRDEEFVDVSRLFQHAADVVPQLARHIGGIQRPRIAAPKGTSFEIGQLTAGDRRSIPLAQEKPMLLHPVLLNDETLWDDLELSVRLRRRLRDMSHAAARAETGPMPLVYLNADDMAGAVLPSGEYVVERNRIDVSMVLVKNGDTLNRLQVTGSTTDLDRLVTDLAANIIEAARHIQ